MDICEMIDVSPGGNGHGEEFPCTDPAVATHEDGQRVCEKHAKGSEDEGFTVTWDRAR